MERSRLVEIVENFGKARVAVLGDFCLDVVRFIHLYDVSRESRAMLSRFEDKQEYPGAAANVAYNLFTLGVKNLVPFTVLGSDEEGKTIMKFLSGLSHQAYDPCIKDFSRKTFVYEKIYARGKGTSTPYDQILRIDSGNREQLSTKLEALLINSLGRNLPAFDTLILSDYNKGVITPRIREYVGKKPCKLTIGTARNNTENLKGFDLLVLNDYETASAYDPEADKRSGKIPDDEIISHGKLLLNRTKSEKLIVTRGKHGMLVFDGYENITSVPTTEKKVVDIVGAGDTTLAAIAASLSVGATLVEAAKIGNYAGGIVVQKPGTATASREEILKEIQEDATLD